VQRHLAVLATFAVADDQVALAGGDSQVAEVQGDGLPASGTGVELGEGQGPVAGGRAFDGAQVASAIVIGQGARRGLGQLLALSGRGSESEAAEEVVDRGQVRVDRGGLALGDGEQVGPVVAGGCVAGGRFGERIAISVGVGQPGQELADPRQVGADGVGVEWTAGP
jgi:hypothetical protein